MPSSSSNVDTSSAAVMSLPEYLQSIHIPIEEIARATNNLADENLVKQTPSAKIYKGRLMMQSSSSGGGEFFINIVARIIMQDETAMNELIMLKDLRHKHIVPIFKLSLTDDESFVIINKQETNESLDKHLSSTLSWMQRLHICVGIADALMYLHYDAEENHSEYVIHGNIKSSKILLDHNWEPKLHGFGFAVRAKRNQLYLTDKYKGSLQYMDPAYENTRGLTHKSDVFSFGVVLFEVLFGRDASSVDLSTPDHNDNLGFARLARVHYEEKTLDDMIDPDLREQMNLESLNIFSETAYFCLKEQRSERPDMKKVLHRLERALELQRKHQSPEHSVAGEGTSSNHLKEDHEVWEPRLPKDYKKLCQMSKTKFEFRDNEIFDRLTDEPERIKNFYDLLCTGFLFQEGKAWFSLGSKEKRNVMISARKFSYANRWLRKWQSIPKSRFQVAAQMLDISNLKVQIKIKPQLLIPGENYGVYLVFKFREPGKNLAKRMYVNLKYKRGSDNLRADFATWREDGWMMIELCQIPNYEEDTDFEVSLESFSRIYCGSSVYIEGIEFRALENEYEQDESGEIEDYEETQKYEDIKQIKEVRQVLKSCSNMDKVQQSPVDSKEILNSPGDDDEGFLPKKVQNEKICFIISKMEVANNSSQAKPFHLKYSAESRFQGDTEISKQQVFGIKGKIDSQMLSPDTDYMCYLVFKLSETCHGLHCPVKVRNVLQWKNKEIGLICFRPPSPWNLPDTKASSNSDLTSSLLLPLTFLLFLINYFRLIISNYFQKPTSYPPPLVSTSSPSRRRATTNPEEEPRKRWRRTRWQGSNGAPKERADGWMEVLVWKFNSNSELRNDHIPMNLKFITYEGTMSGLIVSGLEIRPM